MSKLLVINAHPVFDSKASAGLDVFHYFLNAYKENQAQDETIEQIDLYEDDIPMLDKIVFSGWGKQAAGQELTSREKQATDRIVELLEQFKSANKYLIVYPLHNFNIPSKLKDYMDNVLIPRETFRYTETAADNGRRSAGLLNDGRSVVVIQSSGSIYTNNDYYTGLEYSHKFMQSMFELMGIEDYEIIRVQGTAFLDRQAVLESGYQEAKAQAVKLAAK